MAAPPADPAAFERHTYLSTACLHARDFPPGSAEAAAMHDYCRADTGHCGAKTPGVCKFCAAPCVCRCHADTRAS